MASGKRASGWEKAELIDAIEESRCDLAARLDGAARALNVMEGMRRSFREHTWEWLAAALASGLVLIRSRSGGEKQTARLAAAPAMSKIRGWAVQTLVSVAQPYVALLVQRLVEHWVSRSAGQSGPFGEGGEPSMVGGWGHSPAAGR